MNTKPKKSVINVQGAAIAIISQEGGDYICLTDIARRVNAERTDDVIKNWLRNRNSVEFLGVWETLHNQDFNPVEFDGIRKRSGLNSFTLSAKDWIESTGAIGLISKTGRYGGTYAHKDIAFEFASWISVEFKLYLIKEFQRLKEDEARRLSADWNLHRTLSKINYRIHTDAIKEHLIPALLSTEQINFVYANEADLLNVALFGQTAKQWREANPGQEGNIRDQADIEQLLVLANIEVLNAEFIRMGLTQSERITRLNQSAITQLTSLVRGSRVKNLEEK